MTTFDDGKTKPVATPYDHQFDITEFPTYRPRSTIAPQRLGSVSHRFTPALQGLDEVNESLNEGETSEVARQWPSQSAADHVRDLVTGFARIFRRTPAPEPLSDPTIVTARRRALMHVLLSNPPQTEEEIQWAALNEEIQKRLRWHEEMLRRTYWHIMTAPKDRSLCMRCRVETRSISYDLRELHDALIWLCASCQRRMIEDASVLAARFNVTVRQVIDHRLMDERNVYRTHVPTPKITLRPGS